jgi:hypothetical protein
MNNFWVHLGAQIAVAAAGAAVTTAAGSDYSSLGVWAGAAQAITALAAELYNQFGAKVAPAKTGS